MAKGYKSGGRDFKKGVVTNPNGRPRLPDDVKAARALTRNDLDRYLTKFLSMSKDELKQAQSNPNANMLELLIGSVVTHAVNKGDQSRLGFLLERLSSIGKVREQVEHSGPNGGPLQIQTAIQHLSIEELYEQYSQKKLASAPKLLED